MGERPQANLVKGHPGAGWARSGLMHVCYCYLVGWTSQKRTIYSYLGVRSIENKCSFECVAFNSNQIAWIDLMKCCRQVYLPKIMIKFVNLCNIYISSMISTRRSWKYKKNHNILQQLILCCVISSTAYNFWKPITQNEPNEKLVKAYIIIILIS